MLSMHGVCVEITTAPSPFLLLSLFVEGSIAPLPVLELPVCVCMCNYVKYEDNAENTHAHTFEYIIPPVEKSMEVVSEVDPRSM